MSLDTKFQEAGSKKAAAAFAAFLTFASPLFNAAKAGEPVQVSGNPQAQHIVKTAHSHYRPQATAEDDVAARAIEYADRTGGVGVWLGLPENFSYTPGQACLGIGQLFEKSGISDVQIHVSTLPKDTGPVAQVFLRDKIFSTITGKQEFDLATLLANIPIIAERHMATKIGSTASSTAALQEICPSV